MEAAGVGWRERRRDVDAVNGGEGAGEGRKEREKGKKEINDKREAVEERQKKKTSEGEVGEILGRTDNCILLYQTNFDP